MCLLVPSPSHSRCVVDRGRRETHTPPPSNSFPPLWGEITPVAAISKGGDVQATHRPISNSFTPPTGAFFFFHGGWLTGGSVNPKRCPLLLRLSPLIKGFFFSVGWNI